MKDDFCLKGAMFDEKWLIYSRPRYLGPAKFNESSLFKSIISEGAIIQPGTTIKHSVIGLRSRIGRDSVVEDSIIMGADHYETLDDIKYNRSRGIPLLGIGENCIIKKAIIDKDVKIGDGVKILNQKRLKEFEGDNYCIKDGIVVVEKKAVIPPNTVI